MVVFVTDKLNNQAAFVKIIVTGKKKKKKIHLIFFFAKLCKKYLQQNTVKTFFFFPSCKAQLNLTHYTDPYFCINLITTCNSSNNIQP